MYNNYDNIFQIIMEADGDLEPFDASAAEATPPTDESSPPADMSSNEGVDDAPPPMNEDADLNFNDDGGDMMGDGMDESESGEAEEKENNKLSEKANNILNQKLYQKFVDRNSEISDVIENIQLIVPLLPFEIVQKNDISINHLKSALRRGQDYVIDKFINAQYGENLLFFEKLDTLYTLICDELNTTLKKYTNNHKSPDTNDDDF